MLALYRVVTMRNHCLLGSKSHIISFSFFLSLSLLPPSSPPPPPSLLSPSFPPSFPRGERGEREERKSESEREKKIERQADR